MAFLDVEEGKRVYYEHYRGNKTPVVLVHCWGGTAQLWNSTLSALLSAGHEVVRLDQRGCGQSDKDFSDASIGAIASDVVALVEHCGLDNPVINGWSLGGAVAVEAGSRLGDNVSGLVLTGAATPRFTPTEDWPYGNDRQGSEDTLALMAQDRPAAMKGIADACFAKPVSPELSAWAWSQFALNGPVAEQSLRELLDIDQRQLAREFDKPVLVVAGDEDAFVPYDGVLAAVDLFPSARLVKMEGCGHAPNMENPSAYNAELLSFLQEIGEGRGARHDVAQNLNLV
jgi:pimeloyl-[acyl-carrier protein] methyl ester esterase